MPNKQEGLSDIHQVNFLFLIVLQILFLIRYNDFNFR